ncbi:MAG: O-antigen ligase family protein [Flavobacteriales bacterium]|nr:O-antigen ligase family protein [Flavobacteriales bacterium]
MLDFIIKNIYLFSAAGMLSIGHLYDERLAIYNINITLIISIFYFISALLLILKNKTMTISVPKFIFYLFFILLVIINLINWMIFGANDYGIDKFIFFSLIIIPSCYIAIEVLNQQDINKFLWILVGVSTMLLLLGLFNLEDISSFEGGRITAMGGGPIVFARWMIFAVLVILFNKNKYSKYLYLLIPLFLFMSFTAGSRGPLYAFVIILCLYFLFSFRKNFIKVVVISFLGFTSVTTLSLTENDKGAGSQSTSRVFNMSIGSYARIDRVRRSVKLVPKAPFGVGIGNWAQESNKFSDHQHEDNQYSHNIFLELINESGIVVLLLFVILLITILDSSLFLLFFQENYYTIRITFVLFSYLLINALVSGDIVDNRLMFIMLALFIRERLSLQRISNE